MSPQQFAPFRDGFCDIEAMREFWDGALRRIKAYAEASELRAEPHDDRKNAAPSADG
jgi:hypothetical protein